MRDEMTKWTEGLAEEIGYALNDSIDVDWTPTVGAKAVVAMLHEIYPEVIAAPDLYEALLCAVAALEMADQTVDARGAQLIARAALARAQGSSNVG